MLRRIVIESLPILALAGVVDILAGMTIEKRFDVVPRLSRRCSSSCRRSSRTRVRSAAILAARISTKLHLGTLRAGRMPWRAASEDVMLVYVYAIPVFLLLGISADIVVRGREPRQPGRAPDGCREPARRLPVDHGRGPGRVLRRGRDFRFGLDPDNHGIPLVTSSLDLLGALSLILAIVILGLT